MTWSTNDYPWRDYRPNTNNPANCDYAIRNCDDFTMWRWRNDLGQPCGYFGSALSWPEKAAAAGYHVSGVPAVHTIIGLEPGEQGSDLRFGHVAAVLEVGPSAHAQAGEVFVEEYNWVPYAYSVGVFKVTARTHFIYAVAPEPPPPPTPPQEVYPMFLCTAGTRPAGVGKDPHGDGAVYLCDGTKAQPGHFKRYFAGLVGAALPEYEQFYGPVETLAPAEFFVLDRMLELPQITSDYVTYGPAAWIPRPLPSPDPAA